MDKELSLIKRYEISLYEAKRHEEVERTVIWKAHFFVYKTLVDATTMNASTSKSRIQ